MTTTHKLHRLFNQLERLHFPFDAVNKNLPQNGIYILFEKGEKFEDLERIVRIGTHTGDNNLVTRINEHFLVENKDRSIFRKHIGRAILTKKNDQYLDIWDYDMTSKIKREQYGHLLVPSKQQEIEKEVSAYIQNNLSFVVFNVDSKQERSFWERKLIATLAQGKLLKPSKEWLGYSAPLAIRNSGLWNIHYLRDKPMNETEFEKLEKIVLRK